MMRRLLTCSLLFLAVQACHAQDRMPPPPMGPPMDEIARAIGLKDSQRVPVDRILEQHHAAMMALHETMRGKHDALEKQTHDSLAKVLTPEQLARFEQWHASHRPPPPGGPGGQGPQGGPGTGMRGGPGAQGGPGMRGPGDQGTYGQGGQGRRPPPPGGQHGRGMPPPPPGDDEDDRPPPPPGGDGYGPAPNGG